MVMLKKIQNNVYCWFGTGKEQLSAMFNSDVLLTPLSTWTLSLYNNHLTSSFAPFIITMVAEGLCYLTINS